MAIEEVEKEFAAIIRKRLAAKFHGEFVFEPIRVEADLDLDGELYLHAYIVFDGDREKLDPSWTATLSRFLWPHAEKLRYPGFPIQSFVSKSEWPSLEKKIASECASRTQVTAAPRGHATG